MLGIVWNRDDRPARGYYGYYGNYQRATNGHRAGWWSALTKRFGSRSRVSNTE